ncbi:MAG: tetratricopeptide repeat protein [Proteobacteria bacterium]|nr:tetratricopeptide repeat protein [Pseudomonadota bacterium]
MQHRISTLSLIFFASLIFASCASRQAQTHQNEKQAEALRNLGEAYIQQGNYSAALKELLKAETLTPNDPYLQNAMGRAYMGKDRLDIAISHFKKAILLKPDYAAAINSLGAAYLAAKDWDKAIEIFTELSRNILYGTPHFPLSNLGYAYYNKKIYDLAEQKYLAALDLEPQFIIALRGLGKTYLAQGKIEKAKTTFEKAVQIAPNYAELHSDLAKAYIASKDFKKASDEIKKTIELAPKDSELSKEAVEIGKKLELRLGK